MFCRPADVAAPEGLSGLGYDTSQALDASTFSGCLYDLFLQIRLAQRALRIWHRGEAMELDKLNGKKGCAGTRLIWMLDAFGAAFYRMVCGRGTHPARPDHACGFLPHRRKEQPVAQHLQVRWRMRRGGMSCAPVGFGMANAFPSVEHEDLDVCAVGVSAQVRSRCLSSSQAVSQLIRTTP